MVSTTMHSIRKNLNVSRIIDEGCKREKSINSRLLKAKKTTAQRQCDSLNLNLEVEAADTKYNRPRYYNRYNKKKKKYEVATCNIIHVIGPYAYVKDEGKRKEKPIRLMLLNENIKVTQQQNKIINYCNNKRK